MSACEFLVCGAGIAGASIAAELAASASVVVAEREDVAGYHTTGRSAALYVASYGNAAIRALTAASRAFFDAPPPGFADHPLLTPRGCLHIGSAAQADALDALAAELGGTGVDVSRIGGAAACAMVAVLRPEAVAGGVSGARGGGYRRRRTARRLPAAGPPARRPHRARRRRGRPGARRRRLASAGWRAARRIEARTVVNAAGAWGDELAVLAGARPVGLAPLRRTAMILEAPPNVDIAGWPAVIDVGEAFYFKPEAGRILASPADETPSPPTDAAPDELDIAVCIDRLQAAADIPVRRVIRAWAGLRTFAPDRTPVIGYGPEAPGLFWFAGPGRLWHADRSGGRAPGRRPGPRRGGAAGHLGARRRPQPALAGALRGQALSASWTGQRIGCAVRLTSTCLRRRAAAPKPKPAFIP